MRTKSASTSPEWTDPDDAPPLTEAMLKDAEYFDGDRFIRRGPGRPRLDAPKEQINIRLDAEERSGVADQDQRHVEGVAWTEKAGLIPLPCVEEVR
jgi:hypothetical protein